jgi:flagellar M-ring protein FliF
MAEAIDRLLERGPALWTGLGRARQLGAAVVCLAVTGLLFLGSQWMFDSQYVPLFASLASEDAGAIIAQLKASKTPYRIGGTGEQILVPADKVAELRLRMAVQGLPLGGGVGFEVFDKTSFGVSDFSQRVNYQRALQGELARTIGQLRGVSRARVHLVMPQPSLFSDRERQPSASIFLKMAAGGRLAPEEVRGIVHLVASSVEGLSPERITLVDTAGRVLAAGSDGGASAGLSPRRIEIKTAVEEGLERRVQTLLDSALGAGQAVTRVTAQINFDQVERTEERFDQTPVARQETRTVETTNGSSQTPTSTPAPPPPVTTPAPGAAPPAPAASTHSTTTTRETENVSYELSRIVAKTLTTPGEVQRLSMAVMLNTNTKTVQGPDKKEVREPAPRSPEELRMLAGPRAIRAPDRVERNTRLEERGFERRRLLLKAGRDQRHLDQRGDPAQRQRRGDYRQEEGIQQRTGQASGMQAYPGDEADHHPGLQRHLPARFMFVEIGVAKRHHEGRIEKQGRNDRTFGFLFR